jgi:hypothetical protein
MDAQGVVMRATFLAVLALPALLLAVTPAQGEDTPVAEQAAAEAQAPADVEPETVAKADAAEEDGEFRIPPGFRVKTRGEFTLYCRKEAVMGTRFPVEKCYDESGIREYLRAQREDQQKVDQMRRICSSVGSCGSN